MSHPVRTSVRAVGSRSRAAVLGAVLVLLLITDSAPSGATPFYWRTGATGCAGGLNSADSAAHGFWYSPDLSTAMVTASDYARLFVIDPTDLNTFMVGTLAVDTDVAVYDQDYSTWCNFNWHPNAFGIVGLTTCVTLATNPANACEKHDVRFDQSFTDWASTVQRYELSCHEFGHTLGLGHVTAKDSCMYGGGTFSGIYAYSAHEVNVHLNPNY